MQDWITKTPTRDEAGAVERLERDPASRKRFLRMMGGAGAATAFATFLAACGSGSDSGSGSGSDNGGQPSAGAPAANPAGGAAATREGSPDPRVGTTDLEIVGYALTLEQLETAFYADVVESGLFRGADLDMIEQFGEHEREHRETLEATVEMLGGDVPKAPKTKFPLESPGSVLRLAAEVENVGAAAYLGQANRIRSEEVLAAALSIHSVEARHAATLNALVGLPPEPQGSFAVPASMEEVLTGVQRFIVS
ncbi:MAG: ferritin-like domain-containing protein [Thermoleophilaceae bacterium]|jgi:rubrerythrin